MLHKTIEENLKTIGQKRLSILKELKFLKNHHFYLAGGTALALELGHRVSLDFDFYTEEELDPETLLQNFQKHFKNVQLIRRAENTLILSIDNVEVSLFSYPYPLISPLIKTPEVNLASMEDICAMKIVAIIQRGTKRDFIDIYFLLKEFGLERIFTLAQKKYRGLFNKYLALQALTYFVDADKEKKEKRTNISTEISWDEIKKELIKTAGDFKKHHLS
ncbi:MAG: nucleotidyl transferase AbiEii/AbiGii toxin family protein [Candidatus Aerophobetes bacterium]|nr:nucleotidyl transferase AbiEii/AbiGii toxin family protein [Candidatus Aerophobetes bacterium]